MPLIIQPNGKTKVVKNLGWLLRNNKSIEYLSIKTITATTSIYRVKLIAYMKNGVKFECPFADTTVLFNWIKRPVFDGLMVDMFGYMFVIQKEKFVPYLNNPTIKLSRDYKTILVDILKGVEIPTQHYENNNIMELVGLGYIEANEYGDAYELTNLGKEIAESEFQLREQARKKRNVAARGRSAALSGLGMKRTKHGWE